jgi:poly-gamma-glutamate synthesis protein (capsule biosynthesis protein)
MIFCATGDSFLNRCVPENDPDVGEIASVIGKAEARITNLETTIQDSEGYPAAFSGGTWAKAAPAVLDTLKMYGFNLISWANNHTLDYSHGGLIATQRHLNQYGFVHAGAGKNLHEASTPKYLECPSGRVALIACASTFDPTWIAGEQRKDEIGRPGVNPLRFETTYVISKERLDQLKCTAERTNINTEDEQAIEEGFKIPPKEGVFLFGGHQFVAGDEEGKVTIPHSGDMERVAESIKEAVRKADYVLVSIHAHEMKGRSKDQPAEYLVTFARNCIDAGASAVVGHGPHVLRAIEIYKNCPIFYSTGNFIFHTETVTSQPSDFFEKYGLGPSNNVADALDAMSQNYTRGLCVNPGVWESVIPLWCMKNGRVTDLTLYPIELGFELPPYRMGWPRISKRIDILERLAALSEPFGTSIVLKGSVGKIDL